MKEEIKREKQYKCKYCGNNIIKDTKICPFCGKNLFIYKIINLSIVAVALGLIAFILLISKDVFTYNLDSIITLNKVDYSITSVDRSQGDSSWMGIPKEKNEFIIISLKIDNNNDSEIEFDPSNWILVTENNDTILHNDYNYELESLKKGSIDNRKDVAKVLIYEISKEEEKLKLRYFNKNDIKSEFQVKLY